ncbi:MAG: response regulator, partial [Verrucomicrobia bacterium]|nr:response regulator [Verrucomicrobiota bacterium]
LDLNRVVKNMSKLLGRLIGENITVNYDYCQTLPAILADSSMIEQIILNLAVNARDAMSKGGQLRISTSAEKVDSSRKQYCPEAREGFFVCLTVADTGAGIENHILEHLFEPFFTTKDAGKGTGLGLATVYGIVKQHHGWIEVSSRPGQGTEFRIFFPSCSTQKELTPESTPLLIKGGQETILAVEDESELRNLILSILNRFGYKVLIASSGEEAIDAWDSHDGYINLLLTDVVLQSGMSGRDLAEYLQDKSPDLKVIFASGYSDELIGKDITLQEGLNFLQKPFSPNSLAKAVRNCLDSPIIPVPKRNSNLKTENP